MFHVDVSSWASYGLVDTTYTAVGAGTSYLEYSTGGLAGGKMFGGSVAGWVWFRAVLWGLGRDKGREKGRWSG